MVVIPNLTVTKKGPNEILWKPFLLRIVGPNKKFRFFHYVTLHECRMISR